VDVSVIVVFSTSISMTPRAKTGYWLFI